jgi:DNA polymerase III gamma/tau subunit
MSNLALDLRPSRLQDVVGNESTKRALQKFLDSKNVPNCFLFCGPTGCGKTTLAEIVANTLQPDSTYIEKVNGADKGKLEDTRELVERSLSVPFNGLPRVFILDEYHKATDASQEALLVPTERKDTASIWIFCSTEPDKLKPALRSRCSAATFTVKPLNKTEITTLVNRSLLDKESAATQPEIVAFLLGAEITYPREILGILDQSLAGVPLDKISLTTAHEPLYKDVAGAVLNGNWTKASAALAQIKTADARGLIGITSVFFRNELVKCPIGPRADALATCLVGLDSTGFADGSAYGAVTGLLYKATKAMGAK